MKRFGKLFNAAVKASAFMVAAVIAFSACKKQPDPSVTVNPTEVTSDAAGTSVDVTVKANVAWTAVAADKWVTVSPAEGTGDATVTVTVKKNNSEDARETTVTFTGEGVIATVAVSQFGKDVVSIDKKTYAATPAGGSDAVKVTSNTDWTAASSADWVTVTPAEGAAGETAATVTVAPNATAEAREAKVTFTAGEAKTEYTVSQEAVSVAVSQSTVNVAGEGAEATVTVTANAAWTATASADWVTVDPIEGEAGAVEVTVTADANETEADRTATVTFAVNEDVKAVVTVNQAFVKPTGKVVITVPTITSSTATVVCTPEPLTGFTYYFDLLPKDQADMLFASDAEIIDYWMGYLEELIASYGVSWAQLLSEGVDQYEFTGLSPLTGYYAVAFGVDASGNVTSGLYKTEFTTADVNPAIKDWIGTWTVTSTDSFVSPSDGDSALTGKSITRTITIGTESVFELELGESDLIVAGLSYTDDLPLYTYTSTGEPIPMETVGTIDGNGNLKLVNGQQVMEYGDYGMITWIGSSYIESMANWYMINGSYAPFTLKFGDDKTTATATPYKGKISSGDEFVTNYYDIKLVSGNSASSFYTDETTGALAGTWTLTKVVEETGAASKMLIKKSKAEKTILSNKKKANFMKTFNSKALFAL